MNNNKWFVFSFLAIMLIVASMPLSFYLTTTGDPKQNDPPGLDFGLNKFSSYEELRTFLETTPQGGYYPFDGRWVTLEANDVISAGPPSAPEPAPQTAPKSPAESDASNTDFSTTNIQVEGVDEADIVKTDGKYIYIVTGNNLTIVKAFPPEEAEVVTKISLDGNIMGIFINGDKLALFVNEYELYLLYGDMGVTDSSVSIEPPPASDFTVDDERRIPEPTNNSVLPTDPVKPVEPIVWEPPTTSIKVFDLSDRENPILKRDFSIDGNYFNSRMIGDYVYVISTMYTFYTQTEIALPRIHAENETDVIPANDIYYYDFTDSSYTFTTIFAVNVNDDTQEPTHETILLGGTSAIFVSQDDIYLTFPDYPTQEDETMKTAIQRIKINEQTIKFEATGEVPGYVLNQFSMSEYNGYFRIATTVNNFNWRTFEEATSTNNVYVLDMNLDVVGKLEDLAPGEQIYSVRFMGNRCYVVTFRNIDPLFVIDLSNPTSPKVLGQLKVTGYSDYLHIYDENHIIGIGKETMLDKTEDFAWYQGVKISLFDVSDVTNPVEVAKYEIGDRGTDSPILYDHKALLFDKEKNLLVIPVLVAEIDENDYSGDVPDWVHGEPTWQGAYVFDISPDGIEVRGQITHLDGEDLMKNGYYYNYYLYSVQRSLYIENVLYTISSMKVKMNNLETLAEITTIDLT